ncbi:MAG: hypothetical protein J6V09_03760 [Clostridia bacterium]|nr:hypothetical protein [Clostridia bacterium]
MKIFTDVIRKICLSKTSSDYSLLPSRKRIELTSLASINFGIFHRIEPCKVVLYCDSTCNACDESRTTPEHTDADKNFLCDECGVTLPNNGITRAGVGTIAGIADGAIAVVGLGGFSLFWFVIKKKIWSNLERIFKKQ